MRDGGVVNMPQPNCHFSSSNTVSTQFRFADAVDLE